MDYLQQDRAISVTALNQYIDAAMQADPILQNVCVRGEISNFKRHPSGHLYFSLKDEGGVLRAVMFRSSASRVKFALQDGCRVIARGNVGVYSPTGQYQLYVSSLEEDGVGNLYRTFELLKAKLDKEGLFDPQRKKLIPKYPRKIGIVTSPTGAAIQDMLNILARRYPLAEIVLYPSLVQGSDAPKTLCAGISYFNKHRPDVIIIGRGGGSIEDLWCFNDEELARTIYRSDVPVISAVGHEIDFTISDFVADLRAPTPSAAAELAVPDMQELLQTLKKFRLRAKTLTRDRLKMASMRLGSLTASSVLRYPAKTFAPYHMALTQLEGRLSVALDKTKENKKQALVLLSEKLCAINPLAVLSRGYAVASKSTGELLTSCRQVTMGETFQVQLKDGIIAASAVDVQEDRK